MKSNSYLNYQGVLKVIGVKGTPINAHTVTHAHTHTGANAISPTFLYLIMDMVIRFNFDLFLSFLEIISLRKGLFD